jgi:hypothetical protein
MRVPKRLAVTVLLCASACAERNTPRPDARVTDAHERAVDARIADGSGSDAGDPPRDGGDCCMDAAPADAAPQDAARDAPIA